MKKIILFMPYFGRWPEWFPFYLESCRWNSTINWLFFTDCPVPENPPSNVQFISTTYPEYQELISQRLNIPFAVEFPYKLCDIKPAYGLIHREYLDGYDYFGFSDIDIIYGDIRAFYTDELLTYNTLSTILDRVSGHFFLMKTEERWIQAFRKIPNWQKLMSARWIHGVDEYWLTKVLRGHARLPIAVSNVWGLMDPDKHNHFFKEQYSTPLAEWKWIDGTYNYPSQWYWHQGKLTNEYGGEFMYLHFMNWKSSKHLKKEIYGNQAAWEMLPQLIDPALTDFSQGWCISTQGFTRLPAEGKELLNLLSAGSKS
jgi:hypothetical protein